MKNSRLSSRTRGVINVLAVTGATCLLSGFDEPRAGVSRGCRIPDGPLQFDEVARFDVPEANQGVGVDRRHFYAVNNRVITKHDKRTGAEVARWEWDGDPDQNPLIHLDSAAVIDGKIYAAHSNYSEWPMTSSVEIWDADSMKHVGTHSFGIMWGSMTWLDYHQGFFWGVFANYNRQAPHPDPRNPDGYDVEPGQESQRVSVQQPYGYKRNTTLVKFTTAWLPVEAWVLPDEVLTTANTGNMSNSGGSWGPDGYLYLTGHDPAQVHKVRLPEAGSKLQLVETIPLNRGGDLTNIDNVSIRGQGIAWDRTSCGDLYGIIRVTDEEEEAGVTNKVTVSRVRR